MNIKERIENYTNNTISAIGKVVNAPKDIKYIKNKNEDIKIIIEKTNKKIDPIRDDTNKKLEELGKAKINIFETTINEFNEHLNEIINLPFDKNMNISSSDEHFNFSKKELDDMLISILSIKGILANTTKAGIGGVVSAGAAYTTIAAFGAASTGTLITGLSGIAASNATLAWLGGGALAVGGGGMALGAIVLGGIAIVPAVSYLLWKGKFNYSNEREAVDKSFDEATKYSNNITEIIKNFTELNRLIENTILLMNKFSIECNKLNKQTDHIKNELGNDYNKYTEEQKMLIKKHVLYMTGLMKLINTPVMNEDGSFNDKMIEVINVSNQFLQVENEIKFISYKKKKSIWRYIIIIDILLTTAAVYFYIY